MKITVDTNVLISSSFWHGSSNKIMKKVENRELDLVMSKEMIEEFAEVLTYEEIQDKIKDKNLEMARTVEEIVSLSIFIEPKQKLDIIKEDMDDNKILETALEGNVDYVVSQDKHLLNLKEFRGIKIVNPKEFLEIVSKANSC